MEIIFAKVLGIYFLTVSYVLIFQSERIKKLYREMMGNEPILFLSGLFAIVFGAFIVSVHNVWVFNWPVVITLVGWISLVKGMALITCPDFPNWFSFFYERSKGFYRILGSVWAILGIILLYFSCQ